jgi:hypothetical protein
MLFGHSLSRWTTGARRIKRDQRDFRACASDEDELRIGAIAAPCPASETSTGIRTDARYPHPR